MLDREDRAFSSVKQNHDVIMTTHDLKFCWVNNFSRDPQSHISETTCPPGQPHSDFSFNLSPESRRLLVDIIREYQVRKRYKTLFHPQISTSILSRFFKK